MNPHLALLQPYPFEKVQRLFAEATPPAGLPPISFRLTNRSMKPTRHYNAIVLPGSFLARENEGINHCANFPRIALVARTVFDRNDHA